MMKETRVCVIGAGLAGLTTIKQLRDQNITHIDCFEKSGDLGGIFSFGESNAGTSCYPSTYLTISNYLMAFSDFPPKGHRYHWHHSEYKEYLLQYAKAFGLAKHVSLGTQVLSVEGAPGRWHVVVQGPGGEVIDKGFYEAVAVCSGSNQKPSVPRFPGADTFTGKVSHSSMYTDNAEFIGKDCVVVGMGESAADIVREIADVARSTVSAMRSYPLITSRCCTAYTENPLASPADGYTTHLLHDAIFVPLQEYSRWKHVLNRVMTTVASLLFLLFPWLGRGEAPSKDSFNQEVSPKQLDRQTPCTPEAVKLLRHYNEQAGDYGNGHSSLKFLCKNATFIPNILNGKIVPNFSGIKCLDGDFVVFNDGARARCECLVMCTGFQTEFPFLKGNIGGTGVPLSVPECNIRNLYKNAFHPEIGKSMAWIGFARPATGGVPACAEMVARYFAQLLAGERALPKDVAARTAAERATNDAIFSLSPDVKTLVNYKPFMDGMAELIGCEVKLWKYILQPSLFVRLCLGSMLPSQWRLSGPCSLPELSRATIMSLPVAYTRGEALQEVRQGWLRHLRLRPLGIDL